MRRPLLGAALAALLPGALGAQGSLAVQGYGYPTGQISASALGIGGASAEFDPASALNPAALSSATRYSVYMQYEPEYRRTTVGGASGKTTTMRFPTFLVSGGFRRFTVGLSATTFLDRTYRNAYADSQFVGGEYVPTTILAASAGAITDARFAVSYWVKETFQVGVGIHGLVGENRTQFGRDFPDSTGLGDITQLSTLSYSGRAISLGAVVFPMKGLVVGASLRRGGELEVRQDGGAAATASVPDRFGLAAAWTGIPNTTLALRVDRTAWSDMDALGSAAMTTFDATDIGAGVEVVGPRLGGAPSLARVGFRTRTLPFGANGDQVSERSLSGGLSIPMARGRGQVDLALQRATRSAGSADEKAWFVSVGLGIRP